MLNKITIQGNLGADPVLKHTQSGTAVTSVSIACQRNYKQGEEYKTDWFTVQAWRTTAEFICKFFRKGSQILIEGELTTRSYTREDGQKVRVTEIIAQSVFFCGRREASDTASSSNTSPAPAAQDITAEERERATFGAAESDDDYPF